jgi:hypothetical protein
MDDLTERFNTMELEQQKPISIPASILDPKPISNSSIDMLVKELDDIGLEQQTQHEEMSLEEKIYFIQQTEEFSDKLVSDIMQDNDWNRIVPIFAERVGYLGDVHLYEVIKDEYIRTHNCYLLECVYIGASKGGDSRFHLVQKTVEDGLDINRSDVIFNIMESGVPMAITNLFKLEVENEEAVLFAAGATGNIKLVESLISCSTADIMLPLYGAVQHGDIITVDYYLSKLDVINCVDPYKLLDIALENKQFRIVNRLVEYGLDLTPIITEDIPDSRFNYAKLLPTFRDYMYLHDNSSCGDYSSYHADAEDDIN